MADLPVHRPPNPHRRTGAALTRQTLRRLPHCVGSLAAPTSSADARRGPSATACNGRRRCERGSGRPSRSGPTGWRGSAATGRSARPDLRCGRPRRRLGLPFGGPSVGPRPAFGRSLTGGRTEGAGMRIRRAHATGTAGPRALLAIGAALLIVGAGCAQRRQGTLAAAPGPGRRRASPGSASGRRSSTSSPPTGPPAARDGPAGSPTPGPRPRPSTRRPAPTAWPRGNVPFRRARR